MRALAQNVPGSNITVHIANMTLDHESIKVWEVEEEEEEGEYRKGREIEIR